LLNILVGKSELRKNNKSLLCGHRRSNSFMMKERYTKETEGAYLLGHTGTLSGSQYPINQRRVLIGRDPGQCDLVFDQAVVSRLHAAIELDEQGNATITDLGSSHGTFVNDEVAMQRELKDGDRVGLGPKGVLAFTYRSATGHHRSIPESEPHAPGSYETRESAATALRDQLIASARLATTSTCNRLPQAAGEAADNLYVAEQPSLVRIGRSPDNNIVIEAPGVSRYHASLAYNAGAQPMLTDHNSTNGTFVNGQPVLQPRPVGVEDLIFLGGFIFQVDGGNIAWHDLSASRISALQIGKEILNKPILKDLSLAINPREFVGLMGPSGCGKSTLMDALNGLRPATSGAVYINDLDLYRNFDSLRLSIGHVPQRDILHDTLSVERTLYYAAKLRLPKSTQKDQFHHVVNEVIETVGLQEFRINQFRQLSGGQQKRLSLAIELITKPSFIFLDEPTSPLDPETTENMMELFRRLADEGRIVVMVTHKFEKFELMHKVAILTRGGRLAFFGPPRESLEYFQCQEPSEIYRRIAKQDPDQLSSSYKASVACRRYVTDRVAEAQELARATGKLGVSISEQRGAERHVGLRQWRTLTARYLEIKLKDTRNTALLLLQAPLIAIILAIITGNSLNDAKTIFISTIISIWFGANNAVREIVAEAPIYVRERLVNLKIPSYVMSKFAVLSGIALIQCLLFICILVGLGRLSEGDFGMLLLVIYLTSLSGISMGLLSSAVVNSTEKAMSILPLILIPQLLLSGFLKPVDDLYVTATGKPATAAEYQHYEDSKKQSSVPPSRLTPGAVVAPVSKSEGLGMAHYAADAMIARWAIDALGHAVSIDDKEARDNLAARMTIAEYDSVFKKKAESEIRHSYLQRVLIDCGVLGLFILLFLLLSMWALKHKDAL
jgi:ABC-type multidrug transport system ATPase subunit/pSer/pThr/pTyr-binding forkhead associated (FHA) protein